MIRVWAEFMLTPELTTLEILKTFRNLTHEAFHIINFWILNPENSQRILTVSSVTVQY